MCVCVLHRGDVPADGSGDSGGTGLVSGPAGDHSDPPLSQRDGLQQGAHLSTLTPGGAFSGAEPVDESLGSIRLAVQKALWVELPV